MQTQCLQKHYDLLFLFLLVIAITDPPLSRSSLPSCLTNLAIIFSIIFADFIFVCTALHKCTVLLHEWCDANLYDSMLRFTFLQMPTWVWNAYTYVVFFIVEFLWSVFGKGVCIFSNICVYVSTTVLLGGECTHLERRFFNPTKSIMLKTLRIERIQRDEGRCLMRRFRILFTY